MLEQLAIALTGVTAIVLAQSSDKRRRKFASLSGLAGQPFWFYSAWQADQWGIFGLCVLYTVAWGHGFFVNLVRRLANG